MMKGSSGVAKKILLALIAAPCLTGCTSTAVDAFWINFWSYLFPSLFR